MQGFWHAYVKVGNFRISRSPTAKLPVLSAIYFAVSLKYFTVATTEGTLVGFSMESLSI